MGEWLPLSGLMCRAVPERVVATAGELATHAQLRQRSAQWRAAFAGRSGRWALYLEDTLEFAAALFGAWHAGVEVWLCGDTLPATLDALAPDVAGFAGDMPAARMPLKPLPLAADEALWEALDEQSTRLVVFTSGSTGAPSAIGKSLAQLAREVEALERSFGTQMEGAVVHGTVSHQHIYGLLFRVLWPLAAGRKIAPRRFFHEELAPALAQETACILVSSPAHLKRLPDALDWSGAAARLGAVFSSGGPLPLQAGAQVRRLLGQPATEIYGSSETGGIAWRRLESDAVSPWTPLPGVAWRIVGDQLEVRSPHLATADWWRSQDRVRAQGEGFVLLGRADRIVKIEERRVSLDALERCLLAQPEVAEARVLVLPGARTQLAAVVVPAAQGDALRGSSGDRALRQRLDTALAQGQDSVTRPRLWRFVAALPVNAQGKVTEAGLRALFAPAATSFRPQIQWREQAAPEQAHGEVLADGGLSVFDGHFPQVPILPGVAQLDWAIHFAREAFALRTPVLRVEALKFQQVVRPGTRLHLELRLDVARGAVTFAWRSAAGSHAGGRVLFAMDGGTA